LRFEGIEVLTAAQAAEIYSGRTPLDMISNESLLLASMESGAPLAGRIKRVLDLVIALIACLVLAPLALLITFLIKLSAPRQPVLYTQERIGLFGKTFRIYKFRTMRPDAETETGAVWARKRDPRVTWIGRILRKFRLDEIPQFFNVLRGDMSVVGPRPERPELSSELARQIPFYEERENVMPGLTGWAQVRYPYGGTIEDSRRKLEYDLYYIKHMSLTLDLQIILSTLRIVVLGMEQEH
jgi:exopolysaccharide biosynthesis polyprenyl glycosylphosphotransferase